MANKDAMTPAKRRFLVDRLGAEQVEMIELLNEEQGVPKDFLVSLADDGFKFRKGNAAAVVEKYSREKSGVSWISEALGEIE